MFSYTVSMEPDTKIFMNTCALIDSEVNEKNKEQLLVDVDGSLIQIYNTVNGNIKVLSDYDVYAVYVDSDVNLDQIFSDHAKEYGLATWKKIQ